MPTRAKTPYELYYWPGIPGRGEYIRLIFEAAGEQYVDVAQQPSQKGGGTGPLMEWLAGEHGGALPFAPPFLRAGKVVIAQTALICHFLARRFGLVPDDDASQLEAFQHALTIADLVAEAHDTHHPLGVDLYYEEQKPEALRRARSFREERLPKFLRYFERVLERNKAGKGRHLVGSALSYVDLSMFHTLEGLAYAFPNRMRTLAADLPRLGALRRSVAEHPHIARYLASDHRQPFSEEDVFRYYPELDGE